MIQVNLSLACESGFGRYLLYASTRAEGLLKASKLL